MIIIRVIYIHVPPIHGDQSCFCMGTIVLLEYVASVNSGNFKFEVLRLALHETWNSNVHPCMQPAGRDQRHAIFCARYFCSEIVHFYYLLQNSTRALSLLQQPNKTWLMCNDVLRRRRTPWARHRAGKVLKFFLVWQRRRELSHDGALSGRPLCFCPCRAVRT